MAVLFSKHASFKNITYVYPECLTTYTFGDTSGQRIAMYFPALAPEAYPDMNGSGATTYSWMLNVTQSAFTVSSPSRADNSSTTVSGATGIPWQFIARGGVYIDVQVTTGGTTNTNGTVPNGKGFPHARGGVLGYYEARFRPSAPKDVIMAIQWVKLNAATYGLNPDQFCLGGDSSGASWAGWCGLAPSRAGELSMSPQGQINTVPNVFYISRVCVMNWPYYQNGNHATLLTVTPSAFPGAESGGVGVDDVVATDLQSAPRRYQEEWSNINVISKPGTACIPATYYNSGTPCDSLLFSEPLPENVSNFTPASGGVHTIYHGLLLRNIMPAGLVRLMLTTTSQTTGENSDGTTVPTSLYDGTFGSGSVNDAGTAENPYGDAIDYIVAHIRKPRWDTILPPEGITRRGQVNSVGRVCVPASNPRLRAGVEVQASGNDIFWGTSLNGARGRIEAGTSRMIPGDGWLWLRSAGGGSGVATYIATEVPK